MVIYKTTNLINGKIYVGKDSKNNEYYLGGGKLLKEAIKKYGKKNFKKEIIDSASNIEELNQKERYWINKLNSQNKAIGYNILIGGETSPMEGNKHNDNTKLKMSLNHIDVSGVNNPMYGKTFEDIWRQKGLTDEEIIEKKAKWLLNHNTYFRDNNPFKGSKRIKHNNPFFNKNHSEETRKTLSQKANKKKVLQYTISGEFIKEWESTMDVYRTLKINCRNCCRGLSKTACGFIWKYKD